MIFSIVHLYLFDHPYSHQAEQKVMLDHCSPLFVEVQFFEICDQMEIPKVGKLRG